jgi:hypothetical protein
VRSHGGYRRTCQLPTSFWTFTRQVQKEIGGELVNGLFPELTLEELVFLCHKYRKLVPYEIQL